MTRYQALYRKYRPQRFDEMIGQDHVVGTLTREVTDEKVAHAYLFAGPRGTGKTTTARLLAKSLNCTNRTTDAEPCNECASCIGITEGTSLDVIELDAASHNKVEDVREIRVNVGTVAAAEGAQRIYILDEAHMLSRAAGNALLKTLEEPPEHVVFILATTEPYKLLDTIRSRSQRFDFHPVSSETLIEYLAEISKREGFTADHAGLSMIATHARGSVRDSMSLLEQVAALGDGTVASEGVTRALGLADDEAFTGLVDAIANQDAPAALGLVAQLASRGADLRRFVADSLGFFRGIFLAQYAPNLEEITDEPPEILDEWRRLAKTISSSDVLRAIDLFSEALLHLRQGREERLMLELAVIRLTRPETTVDAAALAVRMDRLERDVKAGATSHQLPAASPKEADSRQRTADSRPKVAASYQPPATSPKEVEADSPKEATGNSPESETAEAVPSTQYSVPSTDGEAGPSLSDFSAAWPVIVSRIRTDFGARRHAFVKVAEPRSVEGSVAVLTMPSHQHFHLEQLNADDQLLGALATIAAEILGSTITLRFVSDDAPAPAAQEVVDETPVRAPEKDDLEEGKDPEDPADVIADMLGGKIVEE
ncbi:MAG: DNA polymerase III subunit gamma/tau [Actinomycetia bacterium]|nr:DNA polymerase III subunit gamma/tau [Actinomycetes bacterium]